MRIIIVTCALLVSSLASAQTSNQTSNQTSRVSADQGRVGEPVTPPPALTEQRVSKYSGATTPEASSKSATVANEKKHVAAAQKSEPKRPATMEMSQKSSWYRIYDAGVSLRRDRDGDGHHSQFQVRFDADSVVGDARVYAKLYVRRVGDTGAWQHYFTTDDFWIYGQSGTDDYFVTTTLDEGFPSGDYDVLIDLYESCCSGIVATLDAYDDGSLGYIPLEETALDVAYDLPGYSVLDVDTSLLIDDDQDGFYSKFKITFDPDTDFGPANVYAVVWIRAQGGEWIKEHESDDFVVDMSGTADKYTLTADWVSGYPTARYDVQLDIHDAATGLLVASAGSERPEFSRIPLEDASRDQLANRPAPPPTNTGSTSSRESGGSMTLWSLFAFAGLLAARYARRRATLKLARLRKSVRA